MSFISLFPCCSLLVNLFWLCAFAAPLQCLHPCQLSSFAGFTTVSAENQNPVSSCREVCVQSLSGGSPWCSAAWSLSVGRTIAPRCRLSITASVKIHTLFLFLPNCHNVSRILSAYGIVSSLFIYFSWGNIASEGTLGLLHIVSEGNLIKTCLVKTAFKSKILYCMLQNRNSSI